MCVGTRTGSIHGSNRGRPPAATAESNRASWPGSNSATRRVSEMMSLISWAHVRAHRRPALVQKPNSTEHGARADGCKPMVCGAQVFRASAKVAPIGISSGGKPEAASSRPLKLKKEAKAVISQIACSFQPTFRNNPISSLSTRLGVSVSLLA